MLAAAVLAVSCVFHCHCPVSILFLCVGCAVAGLKIFEGEKIKNIFFQVG